MQRDVEAVPATWRSTSLAARARRRLHRAAMRAYGPFARRRIRSRRRVRWRALDIDVPAGVFHPGLFNSTRYLHHVLRGIELAGRSLVEVGCGSGVLAVATAQAGARVLALDVNPAAVAATRSNAARHAVEVEVVESDLFGAVEPGRTFDVLVVNPPYFRRDPVVAAERAWFAGSGFEYFAAPFAQLPERMHGDSLALMVLAEECELGAVRAMAVAAGVQMELHADGIVRLERQVLFRLRPSG